MSTTAPSVLSFALEVTGHQPVRFLELVEAQSAITDIRRVLEGAAPYERSTVTLKHGPATAGLEWLTLWQAAVRNGGPGARVDLAVVAQSGEKTIARCLATAAWPAKLVFLTTTAGTQTLETLAEATFHCASLKIEYL